jgi:hypothetical protein
VLFCGTPFAASNTAISFSHDGGQTFTVIRRRSNSARRRTERPRSSPAAGVQRTTDGGVWHGVFDLGLPAVDLGFYAYRGFIVFSNGTMLMTHDAGATTESDTP